MSGSNPQFKAPPAQPKHSGLATGAVGYSASTGAVGYSASHGVEYGRYVPTGSPFGLGHPSMHHAINQFAPPGFVSPPPLLRPSQYGYQGGPPQHGAPSGPPQHGVPSRPQHSGAERSNEVNNLNLPRQFTPNEQCLDSKPVSFLPNQENKFTLLRQVKTSAWSSKHGIANQAIEQVPLVKVLYRGWEEGALRTLSQGEPIFPVFAHSKTDAILLTKLAFALRKHKLDLDKCANEHWSYVHQDEPPSKFTKGSHVFDPMVSSIIETINSSAWEPEQPEELPSTSHGPTETVQEKRIDDLQDQIKRLLKHSKLPEMSPVKGSPLPLHDETDQATKGRSSQESSKPLQPSEPPVKKLKTNNAEQGSQLAKSETDKLKPESAYHPTSTVLGDRPPGSHTPIAMKKWIDALELFSKQDSSKPKLSMYVELVVKAYDSLKAQDRPDASSLAVRWGLPLGLVAQMTKTTAIKASAVAAWLAA